MLSRVAARSSIAARRLKGPVWTAHAQVGVLSSRGAANGAAAPSPGWLRTRDAACAQQRLGAKRSVFMSAMQVEREDEKFLNNGSDLNSLTLTEQIALGQVLMTLQQHQLVENEQNIAIPFDEDKPGNLEAMNRNARKPKKANHGKRPCSHWGRYKRRKTAHKTCKPVKL